MQTISMRLPDDLLSELDRAAKARRVTKSEIVRESLEKALLGVGAMEDSAPAIANL
jgi:metal-responsive CopG/Arc/MetJ family transcriptional regulator